MWGLTIKVPQLVLQIAPFACRAAKPMVFKIRLWTIRVLVGISKMGSSLYTALLDGCLSSVSMLRSPPDLHMASSPFAGYNRQPFEDGASCRSRLSDYGYDTESDSEQDYGDEGDYGCEENYGEGNEVEAGPDQDTQGTKRRAEPFEDCGFWAEVGASGESSR